VIADDQSGSSVHSGSIAPDVHLPGTSLVKLLEFIVNELPKWRDRPGRKRVQTETVLTSQLCAHMNSVSRHSKWDFVQFRTEEADEASTSRKIDLVAAPSGCIVWIDGRKHEDFDPLLPIECKRLPTPKSTKRDKREYLYSSYSTTGGVDRFKNGHHGARHSIGAMIGFIQVGTAAGWEQRLARWVKVLVRAKKAGWNLSDAIKLSRHDSVGRFAVLESSHTRSRGLPNIGLRHLWVEM
jgi:hypothetical protein